MEGLINKEDSKYLCYNNHVFKCKSDDLGERNGFLFCLLIIVSLYFV